MTASQADRRRHQRLAEEIVKELLNAGFDGPTTLEIAGTPYPLLPTPFRLLVRLLPAIQVIRQSSRFNVMVGLSLAVLVGLGCADLFRRLSRAR